jgi:hypothetical protein
MDLDDESDSHEYEDVNRFYKVSDFLEYEKKYNVVFSNAKIKDEIKQLSSLIEIFDILELPRNYQEIYKLMNELEHELWVRSKEL